jgi:hypothetical protein
MSVILETENNLNMTLNMSLNNDIVTETVSDIDDDKNFELNDTWVLWFHKVNDNNWTLNSYVKVYEMSNYNDLLFIIRGIENISAGMFFLMKKGILPIFEDENNKNGGYWSIRITKKDSFDYWQKIIYYMCIKNITIDKTYESKINGISISPKINNCIFKIWTSDFKGMKTDYMRKDLGFINWNDTFYLQHNGD